MNDALTLAAVFASGAGLGWLYFYGLWRTVQRLPLQRWAPLWLLLSLVLRLAVLMGGLYWVGGGDWRRYLSALLGVLLVRLLLTRRLGSSAAAAPPHPAHRSPP